MAFGQQSGPPASHRQVQTLLELLADAGHSDFRDARGPMGFTQRQAGGKFTRDEADALIARLEAEADGTALPGDTAAPTGADRRADTHARRLRTVPTEALAAELQRRGWVVMEP